MVNAPQPTETTLPPEARASVLRALPWLVLALAAVVGALAVRAAWHEIAASGMDFMPDYVGGQRLLAGTDIYAPLTSSEIAALGVREEAHTGMRLPGHPPFASLLFAPLTLLSFPSAALVWTVGSILLLVAVLAWLRRELRLPLRGPWFGVVLALLPLWHPVWYHLHVGQLTIVLFALLVGAWSLEARGRPVLAGCLIGVAVTLKVFPALFLVYALVRKRWRLVGAGLATCTGLILAQTALNPAEWPAYLLEVAPANEAEWLPNPRNDSLASLSFRLFVGNAEVRPFIAAPAAELPARVALYAMAILLQVAWLWRSRRRPDRTADHGLCLSAMVLLSPLTWDHAIVFLLFPFAELWRRTLQGDGGKSRGPMVAVVLALVVSVFPAEVVYVNLRHSWGALPMPAWVHFHAAGLAVVLLGFGATLAGLWHLTRHEGGTQHRGSAPGPAVD